MNFKLDAFDIVVGERVQLDLRTNTPVVIDLTKPATHARPAGRSKISNHMLATRGGPPLLSGDGRRIGGRFWALADANEKDADGDADDAPPSPPTPTPSDHVNDWFNAGYTEEEVASSISEVLPLHDPASNGLHAGDEREMVRRLVHRRLSTAAVKPWKGPLPKVSLPDLTVFDLIRPESWVVVNRKKKSRWNPARSAPAVRAAVLPVPPGLGIAASR